VPFSFTIKGSTVQLSHRWTRPVLGLALAVGLTAPARAQETVQDGDWKFQITPYLWGMGLDGQVGVGQLASTGVEASFSDLWDHLHFAFMGAFEGRRGRWGFATDAFYADLTDSQPTPDALFGEAEVSLTDQFYTAFGTYRVAEGPWEVDVMIGPRYSSLDTELTLTSGIAAGRSVSSEVDWWDALAGVRVRWQSERGWVVAGFADVGGGSDDFTWEALAAAGYRFKKLVTLSVGFRYLFVDYDGGPVVYDMTMAGPLMGIGFRF
jgi:hypothetical protein